MNNRRFVLLVSLPLALWAFFLTRHFFPPAPRVPPPKTATRLYDATKCDVRAESYAVKGFSMEPMIRNKSVITLRMNWYNCANHAPRSSDVVVFENPFTRERVIKKLSMVPGDRVEVDRASRTVKLNGTIFANSKGTVYEFAESELKWFDIYVKEGILMSGVYFLFWDNVRGSIDSRAYGPVSLEGILGKVDL